ncbi:MAG: hypothetical protein ABSA02_10775 [Trebonia sp.]|jgi:hypothetical protein
MRLTAIPPLARYASLRAAAAIAVAALAAAGCSSDQTTPAAAPSASSCAGPAYCAPASWDTKLAATPLPQIPSFTEPLNVVISARSTVSLADLQLAMGDWLTVSTKTTVSLTGIHIMCISSEEADVTGHGYVPQNQAWRLGGCVAGNALSLAGDEDHARLWNQPVQGSEDGAWFVAASYETLCLVSGGKLETASKDAAYAALHPDKTYHCVDGGPGSFDTKHPDGYTDGAATFVAAIASAAKSKGWHFSQQVITVKRGADSGEGGVPFDRNVHVLTVTK